MGSPGGPPLARGSMRVSGVHGHTWALGHMGYSLLAGASMTTRAHAGMIKHEKGMYGSCGSMEAWSDMGPAPAVVCRWLVTWLNHEQMFCISDTQLY